MCIRCLEVHTKGTQVCVPVERKGLRVNIAEVSEHTAYCPAAHQCGHVDPWQLVSCTLIYPQTDTRLGACQGMPGYAQTQDLTPPYPSWVHMAQDLTSSYPSWVHMAQDLTP
eukprot:361841-Chlamydomonas_euryale.AAC.1